MGFYKFYTVFMALHQFFNIGFIHRFCKFYIYIYHPLGVTCFAHDFISYMQVFISYTHIILYRVYIYITHFILVFV